MGQTCFEKQSSGRSLLARRWPYSLVRAGRPRPAGEIAGPAMAVATGTGGGRATATDMGLDLAAARGTALIMHLETTATELPIRTAATDAMVAVPELLRSEDPINSLRKCNCTPLETSVFSRRILMACPTRYAGEIGAAQVHFASQCVDWIPRRSLRIWKGEVGHVHQKEILRFGSCRSGGFGSIHVGEPKGHGG